MKKLTNLTMYPMAPITTKPTPTALTILVNSIKQGCQISIPFDSSSLGLIHTCSVGLSASVQEGSSFLDKLHRDLRDLFETVTSHYCSL